MAMAGALWWEVLVEMPWDGALARPVTKPRQAALHARAPTVNRIHLCDAGGISAAAAVLGGGARLDLHPGSLATWVRCKVWPLEAEPEVVG